MNKDKPLDKSADLAAAILTLSLGVDAVYEVLRKSLSYQAENSEDKILERFIPKALPDTHTRFAMWKGHIQDGKPVEEYKIKEDGF